MSAPNAGAAVTGGVKAFVASLVRTVTPLLVGLVASVLTKIGAQVDEGVITEFVGGLITVAYSAGYYFIVRGLEVFTRWKYAGLFLGWVKAPVYVPPNDPRALAA